MPHESHLPYDASMLFWKAVTHIFFREIRPRGAFNIPKDGPVIFVGAPHHNQFLDPLLLSLEVYKETQRRVQFLTAAASMQRRAVGFFTRLMESIPVYRAADYAKAGAGHVRLSEEDPCLVIGVGTSFTKDFQPKFQIMLPKSLNSAIAEVTEVISDTELRIKKEFGSEKVIAKIKERTATEQAEGTPGLAYKALPFIDQAEMYRHVYSSLEQGGSIGIFPEGGSHDRTELLPLKAGVAIMALGAMANNPRSKVKIVPVGLSYFHPHKFRSRAVVEFGTALEVPEDFVEMFKRGGAEKRQAVSKFLELIYDALKTVTVLAPDYDTLMLVQAARRLYKTPGQHLTLGQVVELNRRMLEGYEHFKDEPRVQALRADVLKYNRLVRDLGLRDHQVPRAEKASWKTLGLLGYRLLLLLVWTVLALPGTVLNGPVFIIASYMSRKKQREALAASVVKVAARDVVSTWKVLISLGVAPILYGFYAFVSALVAIRLDLPQRWKIMTPFMVILALPFMNFAALKFGEAGMDVLKSLRPLIMALVPGQHRSLQRAKDLRNHLSNEVASLINDFGPQLYGDFDKWRILVPSSSAPPSSSTTQGLWRRTSSTGAVDAQGLGLTHPMTWLDERLFGWSQSSKRGTSAWLGNQAESSVATPDDSDNEDEGDYENVMGFLPVHDDKSKDSRQRSRSRNNSYADLQKLRVSPMPGAQSAATQKASTVASPAVELDGLYFPRSVPRNRKASLSDGVSVERLAAEDPKESFTSATNILNEEIRQRKAQDGQNPE